MGEDPMHIDTAQANQNASKYQLGPLLAEGKTKRIYGIKDKPALAMIVSKDDITAGDGAKHDVIPGKGNWATDTTCNVFAYLQAHGLPVAFVEQDTVNSFVTRRCEMLPYEVVVRREAHGSYLKRYPDLQKGTRFERPLCELFLKTNGRSYRGISLPCDDPLFCFDGLETIRLIDPSKPLTDAFLTAHPSEFGGVEDEETFDEMRRIAVRTFCVLEDAWATLAATLADFKIEFGIDADGKLLIADVIDADSCRIVKNGVYLDKQRYRDGDSIETVAELYRMIAEMTGRFVDR